MTTNATKTKRMNLSADRKIFGVCGSFAEYFEIDPTVVRLGLIAITALTGFFPGILAYLIAAIVMPSRQK